MKRILIIGAGFGGIAAIKALSTKAENMEVTLIDRKRTSDFLPELPSVLGRGVKASHLTCDIETLASRYGARFVQAEAAMIDRENMEVHCSGEKLGYEYLIIASGSETDFHGQDHIKRAAYKLDDADDAEKLYEALNSGAFENVIISGGGYTGIEVATNIRLYCDKRKLDKKIYIVERAKAILGPLPQRLREYTVLNLLKMGIKTFVETTILDIQGDTIKLSNKDSINKALLIWASGVKTGEVIDKLDIPKGPQARIKVDEHLRADERIYVIGDAAEFVYQSKPLRMAVQFAIMQAGLAVENIVRSMHELPLKKYKPVDLGYIVPMANNRSCGFLFGRWYVKGALATFMHYTMCVYRLPGAKNKIGLIMDILFK